MVGSLRGAESRCEDHPACREYSCSRPPRRDLQTTSPIGWPGSSPPSGARSPRLRCGRADQGHCKRHHLSPHTFMLL